jgi:DNA repair protein RadC
MVTIIIVTMLARCRSRRSSRSGIGATGFGGGRRAPSGCMGHRTIPVYRVKRIRTIRLSDVETCGHREIALTIARRELSKLDREHILAIYIDNANSVIGVETVTVGTEGSCQASVGCVFRGAILAGARGVIVTHQHPSGNVAPSEDDRNMLELLTKAGAMLGCQLVDFLIVADGSLQFSDIDSIREGRSHA